MDSNPVPTRELVGKFQAWFEMNLRALTVSVNNEQITKILKSNIGLRREMNDDNILEPLSSISSSMAELISIKFDARNEQKLFKEGENSADPTRIICYEILSFSLQHCLGSNKSINDDFSNALLQLCETFHAPVEDEHRFSRN